MVRRFVSTLTVVALLGSLAPSLAKETVPHKVGECVQTAVKETSTRLEGVADSGSAISYTNGIYQVSYEEIDGITGSRSGDPVKLCLVRIPRDCPPGDDHGKTYKATNLRTRESWEAMDSEHMCGGA